MVAFQSHKRTGGGGGGGHTNLPKSAIALNVDEARDRGNPNCEVQYPSQGSLVTRRGTARSVCQTTGCD